MISNLFFTKKGSEPIPVKEIQDKNIEGYRLCFGVPSKLEKEISGYISEQSINEAKFVFLRAHSYNRNFFIEYIPSLLREVVEKEGKESEKEKSSIRSFLGRLKKEYYPFDLLIGIYPKEEGKIRFSCKDIEINPKDTSNHLLFVEKGNTTYIDGFYMNSTFVGELSLGEKIKPYFFTKEGKCTVFWENITYQKMSNIQRFLGYKRKKEIEDTLVSLMFLAMERKMCGYKKLYDKNLLKTVLEFVR